MAAGLADAADLLIALDSKTIRGARARDGKARHLLAHPVYLRRPCRIRSYLTTARSHGRHPLAAIRDALTGNT